MVELWGKVIRKRWERFWWVIDEEKIWFHTWLFYTAMIFIGLYNLIFVTKVPEIMADSLPPTAYTIFLFFCAFGPMASLIGHSLNGQWAYTGRLMQLTGDIAACGVCTIYASAVFYTQFWGQGNIAGGFVMAFAFESFFFIIRGIRRIIKRDEWVKVK